MQQSDFFKIFKIDSLIKTFEALGINIRHIDFGINIPQIDLAQVNLEAMVKYTHIEEKIIINELKPLKKPAPPQINEELVREILSSKDEEDAFNNYLNTEDGSLEQKLALVIWIFRCQTIKQSNIVHGKCDIGSPEETLALLMGFSLGKTPKEVKEVLDRTSPNSPAIRAGISKMASFFLKK